MAVYPQASSSLSDLWQASALLSPQECCPWQQQASKIIDFCLDSLGPGASCRSYTPALAEWKRVRRSISWGRNEGCWKQVRPPNYQFQRCYPVIRVKTHSESSPLVPCGRLELLYKCSKPGCPVQYFQSSQLSPSVQGTNSRPWWAFDIFNNKNMFLKEIMLPIGSMYGIYVDIWGILMVNVTRFLWVIIHVGSEAEHVCKSSPYLGGSSKHILRHHAPSQHMNPELNHPLTSSHPHIAIKSISVS